MGCQPSHASVYDAAAASQKNFVKGADSPQAQGKMFDDLAGLERHMTGSRSLAQDRNGRRTASTRHRRGGEESYGTGSESMRSSRRARRCATDASKASGFSDVSDDVVFLRGELGETSSSERTAILKACLQDDLKCWHLGKNDFGDHGASTVAKALAKSSKLDLLGMGHNGISDSGASRLADAMSRTKAPLRVACFAHNNIGDRGAAALAAALQDCPELEVLDLRSNCIGPEGAKCIAEALQFGCSIKKLQLGGNQIGDEGAAALAAAWRTCPTLEELALEENSISDAGAAELASALHDGSTLLLWGNSLSNNGKRAVRSAKTVVTRRGACCTVGM